MQEKYQGVIIMHMHNKIFTVLFAFVALMLPQAALAMQEGPPPTYYLFLLHNEGGVIRQQEPKSPVPYEMVFEDEARVVPTGVEKGVITNLQDTELATFTYNLRQGDFEVYVPYFSNAGWVRLSDQKNDVVYSYNLGDIAVCDFDKKCGSLVGETAASCPSDCGVAVSEEQNPEADSSLSLFSILMIALAIIGVVLLGVIIYLVYVGLKGKSNGS